MQFLTLVNRLKQETGVSGSELSTLVGLVKEQKRLKDWISQAYAEIQHERLDWQWKRKSVTFDTVADQQTYTVGDGLDIDVSDFGNWRNDSFRGYLTSAGVGNEILLPQFLSFTDFRDAYLYANQRSVTGRPLYSTINPADKSILLWPTPDAAYTIPGEYYATTHELSSDTDEPELPARFHIAIVYLAMTYYGLFEVAAEQIQAGTRGYDLTFSRLLYDQTDMTQLGQGLI